MQDDMATGYTYKRDFIRLTQRELALKSIEKSHKLLAEKQKLVDEGKARWVKKPISKGFILHFELIE